MKAVVRKTFGSHEVLEVREVDEPKVGDADVLVHVRAFSVNPAEWFTMSGTPYVGRVAMGIRRPKDLTLGADFAGTVERVGSGVQGLRVGDRVFGGTMGSDAFAEYLVVPGDGAVVTMPPNVEFHEAAAIPTAGITALQALRDHGGVRPGWNVLINGASGGVGTFAVQIAKALGAQVTGVCRTRNVELVRSLGADHVVDYTREDFAGLERRFELVIDVAGSRPWSAYRRVLTPRATFAIVGGPKRSRLLGPLSHIIPTKLAGLLSRRKVVFFVARFKRADLLTLRELIEAGTVRPIVDRRYALSDVAEAFRYLGEGHARANVVVEL